MTTETTTETTVAAAHPPVAKLPPEVATAIVTVARGVKAVAKNGTNEHGKYMFASVDDFYDAVGPLMAEAGLFTWADMTRAETFDSAPVTDKYGNVKITSWLNIEFDISLVHASGAMSTPVKREVTVVASGPQSYASAESFITKYFIRNLFKIPTGDYDADNDAKSELPTVPPKQQPAKEPAKKQADAAQREQAKPANETASEQNIKTNPENRVDPAQEQEQPAPEGRNAKLKPVLEFVATVNAFLDTKPTPGEVFTYEGKDPTVNRRFKLIRSDEYSAVPAVQELLKRINAIYATAPDATPE